MREEIISNLLYMKRSVKEDTIEDRTIDEAIKALEQEPCDTLKLDGMLEDAYEYGYQQARHDFEVQPCEDAVSREAVDELSKALVHTTRDKADFLCNFWEGLQKLPPVTPKQRWIPVSERLPESAGVYIVTREFTDGFECVDLTDACYFDGTDTWHNDNRINHGREYVSKKIKAWMPLPEPWKEKANDT